ncbi:Uncharacterised protein [Klebsiella pneumoniae]|nr:Uncharacterised protein [Klebsiella pneumoniae]VGE66548.1 Uncharacterised protein [Klebsiella pneumoniae]VGF94846.1 Uncharacterised protein [Klebsiella pneumoniae]
MAAYLILRPAAPQHHQPDFAQLRQDFVQCAVLLQQLCVRLSGLLQELRTAGQHGLALRHQQPAALTLDADQRFGQLLPAVNTNAPGQVRHGGSLTLFEHVQQRQRRAKFTGCPGSILTDRPG